MLAPARRTLHVGINPRCPLAASQRCCRAPELQSALWPFDQPPSPGRKSFSSSRAQCKKIPRDERRQGTLQTLIREGTRQSPRRDGPQRSPTRDGPWIDEDLISLGRSKSIPELLSIYERMEDAQKLSIKAFSLTALSRRLLGASRGTASGNTSPAADASVNLAKRLASDIKKGKVKPSAAVCSRLLSIYHETGDVGGGNEWWEWLRAQDIDNGTVSTGAYAAAIRFLTSQKKSLVELEALYSEALTRWPGDFQEYYLSANSILPNRNQHFTAPAHLFLLDAIAQARLANGNTRDAYLALDTMFRLVPSEPYPPMIQHFMANRPLPEALAIHAMACRGGGTQRDYIYDLSRRIKSNSSNSSGSFGSILAARQVLSVLFLEISAGPKSYKEWKWADQLVSAIARALQVPGILLLSQVDRQVLVSIVLACVRTALEIAGSQGNRPTGYSFNCIIKDVAGFGQNKDVVHTALEDASKMGLQPDHTTMRSILTAAGRIGDPLVVKESWQGLVEMKAIDPHTRVDEADIHGLIKAARLSGISNYAREVIAQTRDELPEGALEGIMAHLDNPDPDPELTGAAPDMNTFTILLRKLQADLDVFAQRLKGQKPPLSFKDQELPMRFRRTLPEEQQIADADLRQIYDEMTTDATLQTTTEAEGLPALSQTDIPLGTLRFENWKDMNFLLAHAMKHDAAYEDAVDASIAADSDVVPPSREEWPQGAELDEDTIFGLSDLPLATAGQSTTDPGQVEQVRQEVFSLRGVAPAGRPGATESS